MTDSPARPELYLPDLPELSLGLATEAPPALPAPKRPWPVRLRALPGDLAHYLPLLLMLLLALATGWLLKHTPSADAPRPAAAPRERPDYTMRGFSVVRFDRDGRLALRIDGDVMRHLPLTDRLEIDGVRIHAVAPDGRVTDALARHALANGDGSELQLLGGAQVTSQLGGGRAVQINGEFLHAFLRFERLRSHLPVVVRQGQNESHAAGIDFDNLQRTLQLSGPVRSRWLPPGRGGVAGVAAAASAAAPSPSTSRTAP